MENLRKEVIDLIKYRHNSKQDLANKANVGLSTINRVLEDKPVSEGMLLKLKNNLK